MNMKQAFFAVDVIGIIGIFIWLSVMTFTKLSLGSVLTVMGTFWRSWVKESSPTRGRTAINVTGLGRFEVEGTLRFMLVSAGLVLIVAGAFSAQEDIAKNQIAYEAKTAKAAANAPTMDQMASPADETHKQK